MDDTDQAHYGMTFHPFRSDVPVEAMHTGARIDAFLFRHTQQVRDGGFSARSYASTPTCRSATARAAAPACGLARGAASKARRKRCRFGMRAQCVPASFVRGRARRRDVRRLRQASTERMAGARRFARRLAARRCAQPCVRAAHATHELTTIVSCAP
jgi:hypothetical protein